MRISFAECGFITDDSNLSRFICWQQVHTQQEITLVLAVTEDRMLDGEERNHFGRCAEYVYGKEAFLTLREAMARREEVAHSEHKI